MLRHHLSRTVMTALAAVLLPFGVGLGPAHAASHSTAKASGIELNTAPVTLTSSTGKKLRANILASRFTNDGNSGFFAVDVWDAAGESHEWELSVTNSALTYNAATGHGRTQVTHQQIAPLGAISLAVKARGAATRHTCPDGDSYTQQPVTLTGTFRVDTQTKAWGTVGSTSQPVTFNSRSRIQTDYGNHDSCFYGSEGPCVGDIGWDGTFNSRAILFGEVTKYHGKWASEMSFDATHSLSKPVGATRDDFAEVFFYRHPKVRSGAGGRVTLAIRGGSHGLVTGSAKLVSVGPEKTESTLCRGGTTKTWKARLVNGAQPLTAHMQIGGTFTERNGTDGADITADSG